MALANEAEMSRQEIVDAEARVWNQVFSFANSMSLKCAVQLGIPDVIHRHGKPMTLPDLVDALPINKAKSDGLRRLMRILTHAKFFDKIKIDDEAEQEGYCLTGASRLLLKDGNPMSMNSFVHCMFDPFLMDPWRHMSEWFQNNDDSSFVTKHGRTFWEYVESDKTMGTLFNDAMSIDAGLVAGILVKDCRQVLEGLKTVVDVGGGTGVMAKGIADGFPGLKSVVLDLPHVVEGLAGAENLSFVAGDMFESIPHADAVLLKWVLHDWSDEDCVKILKKCKEAITPSKNYGGKVIIIEMVVDAGKKEYETQLFFDLQMMVEVVGKERTEREWANIFTDAGFPNYKIHPIIGLRSVIEIFP